MMKDSELLEKQLSSKELFSGKIISLRLDEVELPNGGTAPREVVHHKSGAAVIVPVLENGDVLLVRQCRYPFNAVLTEVPAGKLDPNETPLQCAARELTEETGGIAKRFRFLGESYPSPGFLDEVHWMYLATDITFTQQKLDDDEFINLVRIPLKELAEKAMNGELKDAKTQIAILKAYFLMGKGEL